MIGVVCSRSLDFELGFSSRVSTVLTKVDEENENVHYIENYLLGCDANIQLCDNVKIKSNAFSLTLLLGIPVVSKYLDFITDLNWKQAPKANATFNKSARAYLGVLRELFKT